MKTIRVQVWDISIGWGSPIRIQSMTNTPTSDIEATVKQIIELADAGSELIRITVDSEKSAEAVPEIIARLERAGYRQPIIWDFHYNGHILLEKYPLMASRLAKYRINPGNVWTWKKKDENFNKIISLAIKHWKPIRIWVNWWSLDQELLKANKWDVLKTMIDSAILSADTAIKNWLAKNKIILSVKVSHIEDMINIYTRLSKLTELPLHLWLTEAWAWIKWIVWSTVAISKLLSKWIWDTFRVSITPNVNSQRTDEVEVCKEILQALGLRRFHPNLISCPWCGRTTSRDFQELAKKVDNEIKNRLIIWKNKYELVENMNIAVMGCIVNWPGESRNADIWISFPWISEDPILPVYIKGKLGCHLKLNDAFNWFMRIIEEYLDRHHQKK